MEKIVPLAGLSVKGPLGVTHLPRFWLKAVLAASGVLADDYVAGNPGMNGVVMAGLGLDPDVTWRTLRDGRRMPRSKRGFASMRRGSTRPRSRR